MFWICVPILRSVVCDECMVWYCTIELVLVQYDTTRHLFYVIVDTVSYRLKPALRKKYTLKMFRHLFYHFRNLISKT